MSGEVQNESATAPGRLPSRADESLPMRARRTSLGSARTLRYVSLLYTCFFFIEPYYQHSSAHWLWLAAFYVVFLANYFAIVQTNGRTQQLLLILFFALSLCYFPYNESASGAFVYPVVMCAFLVQRIRTYIFLILAAVTAIAVETWAFHLHIWAGGMGAFFCVVIGLSNFAYSRQQQANTLLQCAHEEIEQLAQVAERERIARDLHDLLGHTLTVIAIKSELANRLLDRDPQRARQEMLDVEQTARVALTDVREAVAGYRSQGLAAELLRARRTLLSANVALSTSVANAELSTSETNVLCLCLREAVTNIVRHAEATACEVQLACNGTSLTLTVRDNGRGCSRREGNGLRGMRERVLGLKGMLLVMPAPAGGTTLTVTLPASNSLPSPIRLQQEHV